MISKTSLFLFYFLTTLLFSEEYTLYVRSQKQLKPLYVECRFSEGLVNNALFEKTVRFDLDHCGFFELTPSQNAALTRLFFESKKQEISIKIEEYGKTRTISFPFSSASSSTLLAHQTIDFILNDLLGEPGIFSDRIIYSSQNPTLFESEIHCKYFDQEPSTSLTSDHQFKMMPVIYYNEEFQRDEFLYVSYALGPSKIFSQSFTESQGRPFIQLRGSQFLPSVSSNGEWISFISDVTGQVDLFIQRLKKDGKKPNKPIQLFSYPQSVQATSSFSPDQTTLAFVSDFEKKPKIYLLNLLNTLRTRKKADLKPLISFQEATCPAFSPDGEKIAFCSPVEGTRQLFIYNLKTMTYEQLTEGPFHKENPSWAKNSLHLVYNTSGADHEIYVINLNQKTPIKITTGPELKHYPCWEQGKKRKI